MDLDDNFQTYENNDDENNNELNKNILLKDNKNVINLDELN